jgi:hypothetical protein
MLDTAQIIAAAAAAAAAVARMQPTLQAPTGCAVASLTEQRAAQQPTAPTTATQVHCQSHLLTAAAAAASAIHCCCLLQHHLLLLLLLVHAMQQQPLLQS